MRKRSKKELRAIHAKELMSQRKFFNKKYAIEKQETLKEKGIKTKLVKTTKVNPLFEKDEQKRDAWALKKE